MDDRFIRLHKAKHLLAHVLVAAGAHRWPQVTLGDSGETATGFFADFAMPDVPGADDLATLLHAMRRLMGEAGSFRGLTASAPEARKIIADQPWKSHVIEALAEGDAAIGLYELDGVIDLCDCAIKSPDELRAIPRDRFVLTGAVPIPWLHRGQTTWFDRIRGELVPAPPPCSCCPA